MKTVEIRKVCGKVEVLTRSWSRGRRDEPKVELQTRFVTKENVVRPPPDLKMKLRILMMNIYLGRKCRLRKYKITNAF